MDPIRSALLTANRRRYEDGGAPAVRAPSPVIEAAPLRETAAPPADKAPAVSEADIQNLYKTTKGIEREADPSGLSYWMDQAKGGMSLDQMQQAFLQAAQDPLQTAKSDTMKSTGAVASFGDNPPQPPRRPIYNQAFDYSKYDNPFDARYAYLSQMLNPTIAAAMMGNYGVESFNNPNQLQTNNGTATGTPIFDKNNMPTGYGAAMWGKERLTNPNGGDNKMGLFDFADKYGYDPNSTEGQDRFAVYELTQNPEYAGTYKGLIGAGTNVNKATQIFGDQYENPANLSASLAARQANAGLYQNYFSNPSSLSAADQAKIAQTKSGMFDPAFQKYAADKAAADKATQLAKTQTQTQTSIDPMMDTVSGTNIVQPTGIGNDALSQQLNSNQGTDFSNLGMTGMNPYNMNTTFSSSGGQDNNQNGISIMNGLPDWYSPYAHGGMVGHALRLAHHYATGGHIPSQPDIERGIDRINRMLSEKAEVDPATQDWSARRNEYLQGHPGPQIRDRSFARGGYADGGDAESVLMQERQAVTPSSMARSWTPPEETIEQNFGPRQRDIMENYPEKLGAIMGNVPGAIAHSIQDPFELAHQAATNQLPPDYFHSDEGIGRALNAAGIVQTGAMPLAANVAKEAAQKGETMLGSAGGTLYHGSPVKDLTELNPSARGPLGPGTYATPDPINIAKRYAGEEGQVYQLPNKEMDIFRGSGHRTDAEYAGFKNDKQRLIDAVEPEMQDTVVPMIEKMWSGDGYPLYWQLRKAYGGDEGAQNLFKRAKFEGFSGQVDGPETVIFNKVPLKTEPQMSVGPAERAENLAKFKSENVEDVPPIVYHGTGNDIHQFDTTKGAWFTDTPSLASEYANKPGGNVVPVHIALKNPIEFVHAEQRKPIGEVISTALSGAHDLSAEQINAAKPIVNILRERYGKNARPLFEYWNNDPDITKLFKTLGYDGISVFEKADRKAKTWSIFSPEQAKSAIGNAGTFNPKSPKLNEARGGTIPFGPEAAQRAVQIAKQQAGRR